MNCFESDFKRAVMSFGFLIGLVFQIVVLFSFSDNSLLYRMSVPIACTLPFSCGFLDEYKNGFIKFSLSRANYFSYITSKFLSAGISGGILEVVAMFIYYFFKSTNDDSNPKYLLLFLSAFLWSSVAILFAAISKSRYMAFGGSFVIYYFLIIIYERYWKSLYCLNPVEWYQPQHIWIFDENGIVILVISLITILFLLYYRVLRGLLENA